MTKRGLDKTFGPFRFPKGQQVTLATLNKSNQPIKLESKLMDMLNVKNTTCLVWSFELIS
jgi:hypothetical protein